MNVKSVKVKSQAKVVFLDAAGTLIRLKKPAGWHYARVAERHGVEVSDEEMQVAFIAAWKARAERRPAKGKRRDDDRGWWRGVAVDALRSAAKVSRRFDETAWFEELYERFAQPGVWELCAGALEVMEYLRGKYRLGVLSNFDGRLRRILGDLGVAGYFEKMVISSEIGCEKPHREAFLRAALLMGVEAAECVHVGDDPARDWMGARRAGMGVIEKSTQTPAFFVKLVKREL